MSTNEIAAREPSRTYLTQFGHNVVYLFVGRHFGLLPYFFPGMFIFVTVLSVKVLGQELSAADMH